MSVLPELPIALAADHVRVIVLDAEGRMLQLLRADRPVWEPVEGHVGDTVPGETAREAAVREAEEETGYGGASLTWEQLAPRVWVVHLPPGADDPTISDEHLAWRWTTPEDAERWLARERFYSLAQPAVERAATAYHEAGHTIALAYFGAEVRRVTIDGALARAITKNVRTKGVCEHEPLPEMEYWTPTGYRLVRGVPPMHTAVCALAGLAAHAMFLGLGSGWAPAAEEPDLVEAASRVAQVGGSAAAVAARAAQLVIMEWPAVRRIAEALLARGTLAGREIAVLLEEDAW